MVARPPLVLQWLVLALLYLATGRLAMMLAIPPGFATAIFPPIGIGVAATLLWGYRMLPGVLLGSALLNASIAPTVDASSLPLALEIALGSTLACAAGCWLVRRHVGFPDPLTDERSIFLTLALAGPLACLLSAGIGSSSLVFNGVIPSSQWAISAWTWWVGDSIGVLIALPLTLILFAHPRTLWRNRMTSVGVPLLLACAVMVAVFLRASQVEHHELQLRFHEQAKLMMTNLRVSFQQQALALRAVERLFAVSDNVERRDFANFAQPLRSVLPGLHAISWNRLIEDRERSAYESSITPYTIRQRGADGQLIKAPSRETYVPITYIEPASDEPRTLGFDVYLDPTRREAMDFARDTGELGLTAPISLVQDQKPTPGVLFFKPVYRQEPPPTALEERREQLRGFAVAVLRIRELVAHALAAYPDHSYQLQIVDATTAVPLPLFDSHTEEIPDYGKAMQWQETLDIGGRKLLVTIAPSSSLLNAHRSLQSWVVLAGGLLLCSLLGGFLLSVSGRAEQIRQQVRLRTLELSAIFDHAAESIVIFAADGQIERANPATAKLFGLELATLTSTPLKQLLPSLLQDLPPLGQGKSLELIGQHANGSALELEISLSQYELSGQARFVGVLRDIGQRKRMERLKREFVSTVSHELRTPLTSIKGSLGLLQGGVAGALPEAASELVNIAHSNSERLVSLVNDILDIEKLESGQVGLHLEPLDLVHQLQQALTHNQGFADNYQVTLQLDTASLEPGCQVQADALRLQQVLSNLISNAIKFSEPGQTVELTASLHSEHVLIAVQDHGSGIPAEFQSRIFQKFAQADGSDTRKRGGTGLGLSICKMLVERMKGEISFQTSPSGTCFQFTLPRS